MAGHSKWANIKHKKAATDAKRGKVWTRVIKEISVAARLGGIDLNANPRLRLAVDKASAANIPKDNVERAIQRGSGTLEGISYEEVTYEGYGIHGAAVIVACLTDNKMRTVAEVRHIFTKYGGNMATSGAVSHLFQHCGQLLFAPGAQEEALIDAALKAGAQDIISDNEGGFHVITAPQDFFMVKEALNELGVIPEIAAVTMKPHIEILFLGENATKMQKMFDAFEALDDVQEIYSNVIFEEL